MLDGMGAERRVAVVGVADHSGWANLVTVSITPDGGAGRVAGWSWWTAAAAA